MVREITVEWTTVNGGGKVSVFNFEETFPVDEQRAALANFLNNVDAIQHSTTSWRIATAGREFSEASGELQGAWTAATPYTGTGSISAGQVCADATQALVRWQTGTIVAGRFLQGRTFLPGIAQGALVSGNLGPTSVTLLATSGNTLVNDEVGLVVWRRPHTVSVADPRPSYVGRSAFVESASAWAELAVLRRRRG